MSQEYYTVLARTMEAVGRDHAQMRMMIYKFARSELRRELFQRKNIRWIEMKQQITALEQAIERIEADVVGNTLRLTYSPAGAVKQKAAAAPTSTAVVVRQNSSMPPVAVRYERNIPPPAVEIYPPERDWPHPALSAVRPEPTRPARPIRSAFWSIVQLVVAVVLGVALFNVFENHPEVLHSAARYIPQSVLHKFTALNGESPKAPAPPASAPSREPEPPFDARLSPGPQLGDIPIPKSYGVYAVVEGKLVDLQSLPIKVPDQRVAISAMIPTPSSTALADGRLQFVGFRRDLASRAPDRVQVRIVARVMHALTFDPAGKARKVGVEKSWAVRGNSYELKVAPVNGSGEMIVIRPEDPEFVFPSGRYALLLNGEAYDFSVDGPITDTAQCLERTDALNAPVYTECRSP